MRCDYEKIRFPGVGSGEHGEVVAIVTRPGSHTRYRLCEVCLNAVYDTCDDRPELEPVAVQYEMGWITRWLQTHMSPWHWSRRTLVRRGDGPYSDLARRLITEHRA